MSAKTKLAKIGRKLGRYVGYPMFFIVCFVLFTYWTFPYERVKDFIIQEVEMPMNSRSGQREASGYELEIIDLAPSWFTGVELTGVSLSKASDDPEAPPAQVTFEYINARVSLLSLLVGDIAATFDTRVAGGTIEGEFEQSGNDVALDVHIDSVRSRRIGFIRQFTGGLPLVGQITGHIVANLPEDRAASAGEVELHIEDMVLGDGVAKIRMDTNAFTRAGLTFPETSFGDVDLELNLAEGTATVTKLEGRGDDIELDGTGTVRVRNAVATSTVDAMLRIGITEEYRTENAGLFTVMEQEPRVRAAKTPDGDALQFHVAGNIGPRMRFQGAGRSPRPGTE